LAEVIADLAERPDALAITGERAREYALDNCTRTACVKRIGKVFSDLVNGPTSEAATSAAATPLAARQ
jgi:hypothetical protein